MAFNSAAIGDIDARSECGRCGQRYARVRLHHTYLHMMIGQMSSALHAIRAILRQEDTPVEANTLANRNLRRICAPSMLASRRDLEI